MGPAEMALARMRVREICDAIDMPTRATRQLLDDLESGRTFLGIEGLLPAFYLPASSFLLGVLFVFGLGLVVLTLVLWALRGEEPDRPA